MSVSEKRARGVNRRHANPRGDFFERQRFPEGFVEAIPKKAGLTAKQAAPFLPLSFDPLTRSSMSPHSSF
jgi:hypothetical protein